jgi:hypothetical protein
MLRFVCAAAAALALAAPCEAGVRKCVDAKGRVTFQDAQCPHDAQAPKPASAPASAPMSAPVSAPVSAPAPRNVAAVELSTRPEPLQGAQGTWRGPALFHLKQSGDAADARANTPIELELLPDGSVRGAAASAGCRFEGVHTPYEQQRIVSVDITLSGCNDARFNARYAGQLNARTSPRQSRLGLHAIVTPKQISLEGFRDLSLVTIDAVLRR